MTYAILADGLEKRFGDTVALAGIDLAVPAGTVLGLLGPNGAGKTTTVRILASLVKPDAGRAMVGGYDLRTQAHQVREIIGLTGQYASVDEKLTGRENLLLIGRLLGLSRAGARKRADILLAEFHLDGAANRAVQTYSGGMRRRLDLAASLVGNPRILFLDEPSVGLDPRARQELWGRVRALVANGTTVLLTTQYLDEADALADNIVLIDQGRVIAAGTPDALKTRIGGRTLVVGLSREDDIPGAIRVIAEIAGVAPAREGMRVVAMVPHAGILPELVRRLDAMNIPVDELSLRGASLDEVFLTLTGQRADDGEPCLAAMEGLHHG